MVVDFFRVLWRHRDIAVFLLTPVVFLPLPLVYQNQISRCGYVMLVMAVYWTTEAIPIAVTGMVPFVALPLADLMSVKEIASLYLTSGTVMFVGGLMVACAVERCNLHRRIALAMLFIVGSTENRIILGLMLPTWFLSMWISNTATAAMMTPVAIAILNQIQNAMETNMENGQDINNIEEVNLNLERVQSASEISDNDNVEKCHGQGNENNVEIRYMKEGFHRLQKAVMLCIAYSANVGGTASLIGTPPNIVLLKFTDDLYDKIQEDSTLSFATWFLFGLPVSVLCFIVIWVWMQLFILRGSCIKSKKFITLGADIGHNVRTIVRKELNNMGPMSFAEKAVLGHFILLVLLWFFRHPRFITGWNFLFTKGYVTDATSAILVVAVMFVFPYDISPEISLSNKSEDSKNGNNAQKKLLSWTSVQQGVPWMVVWLFGGGYALAGAAKKSGFSLWIGDKLIYLSSFEPWVILFIVSIIAAIITEATSNTAIAAIFLPILQDMALNMKINPLYFMFPVTLATSFAFMLPVATPPNAIVYSTGRIKLADMIKSGIMLNILCICVVNLGANTWGKSSFDFGSFPPLLLNLTQLPPTNGSIVSCRT